MKRIYLLILALGLYIVSLAQTDVKIDLDDWKGRNQRISFKISTVQDNRQNPDVIGRIKISKTKNKEIAFDGPSNRQFENFIAKNYTQGKELDVRMEIERIDISEIEVKKKKMHAFYFACKFYKNDNSITEPLYSFNARNSIPKKNALKLAMTNYLGRAITSAISNFKTSYKKHPEWQKENINAPTVNIKKNIFYNQFAGGDTIALDGKYKLKSSDFMGVVGEEEKDDAYSYFMMTYQLNALDDKKNITLNIYPELYFLRSRSWAKKDSSSTWLPHQQLLFDLATHHGQLFKNAVNEKDFSAGYYKAEINKIYNKASANYFDEMDQLQAETQYGENKKKEKEWREKVDKYLSKP